MQVAGHVQVEIKHASKSASKTRLTENVRKSGNLSLGKSKNKSAIRI